MHPHVNSVLIRDREIKLTCVSRPNLSNIYFDTHSHLTLSDTMNGLGRSMARIIRILYNKSGQIEREEVNLACDILNKGGVIAVPTDTIYGLAAKIDDNDSLERIYKIKGRDHGKPLSICLSSIDEIDQWAATKHLDRRVLPSLLPGPLTLILERKPSLNSLLNPGVKTIGVRVPDHNFIRAICAEVGPLALTSANLSGEPDPLLVNQFEEIWPHLDCIFDCGLLQDHSSRIDTHVQLKLGSTVIDLSQKNRYTIVREGCSIGRATNLLKRFGFKQTQAGKD